jgi:hypothetical protein
VRFCQAAAHQQSAPGSLIEWAAEQLFGKHVHGAGTKSWVNIALSARGKRHNPVRHAAGARLEDLCRAGALRCDAASDL